MTVGEALQAIGRAALSHLCASVEALRERPGPEGVHQLRVALRRARAMLKIFKPLAGDETATGLAGDLKWLAGELDTARDLDVFVAEVWRPASQAAPAQDMAAFGRALLAAQTTAYLRMEAALESPRQRGLMLDLAAWLEAGSWTIDPALADPRDQPAPAFAAGVLEKLRHGLAKRGAHLDDLDPQARHRLRLKGKVLRYAAEDLAGLFPHHPKRVEGFVAAARAMQDRLGDLNDQARRASLAREVAIGAGEPEAAFAAGRLTANVEDDEGLNRAVRACRDLAEAKAFW